MDVSSASADEGLAAALNNARGSRTKEGYLCLVVNNDGAAHDCSSCLEGETFSTVESISTLQGDYDLISTGGSGRSRISICDPKESDSERDGFIRGILRTETYFHVAAIVFAIFAVTSLCRRMLPSWYKPTEPASPGSAVRNIDRRSNSPKRGRTGGDDFRHREGLPLTPTLGVSIPLVR